MSQATLALLGHPLGEALAFTPVALFILLAVVSPGLLLPWSPAAAMPRAGWPSSPLWMNFACGAFMSVAHWAWFSLVAVFFSSPVVRRLMIERKRMADRLIGVALMGLGVAVTVSGVAIET